MKKSVKFRIRTIILVLLNFASINLIIAQDIKLKKTTWKDEMEILRLRKLSLESEKKFLLQFSDSLIFLDSLLNELEKCKKLLNDTLKTR